MYTVQNNILKGVCGGSSWPFLLCCLMFRSCLHILMGVGSGCRADCICQHLLVQLKHLMGKPLKEEVAGGAARSKLSRSVLSSSIWDFSGTKNFKHLRLPCLLAVVLHWFSEGQWPAEKGADKPSIFTSTQWIKSWCAGALGWPVLHPKAGLGKGCPDVWCEGWALLGVPLSCWPCSSSGRSVESAVRGRDGILETSELALALVYLLSLLVTVSSC